jgi:hypothetical protein
MWGNKKRNPTIAGPGTIKSQKSVITLGVKTIASPAAR